jgi:predicted metalloprotease with PDZ domain
MSTVHYRVDPADLQAHLFSVTLTVGKPAAMQRLTLPVWIPGSYLVREFSKHLQNPQATQDGNPVPLRQLDKHQWEVTSRPGQSLTVTYQVYAYDNSVRTAWLDTQRGFFNGTSLCLRVDGQEQAVHTLEVITSAQTAHWSVATGARALKVDGKGFGSYQYANYDELVDCPVEMGDFWSGTFKACGVPHRFVVAGAPPSFDGDRLLADTQKICEAEIRFWHGKGKPPYTHYVFMLNAVHDGYGGLEHCNSTALICPRKDLPRLPDGVPDRSAPAKPNEGYTRLLGLISHEYFHTWNVKRLRPAELARYDYTGENYTELLWFFEGFTSYYDDVFLVRSKRIDHETYLGLLSKTINQVNQTPGRLVQTVAQASFDAWVKYYRQDENTPNATISYYTKGSLIALCLDLTLRLEGRTSLDAVMVALWKRCNGGPMAQSDLADVVQQLAGRSFATELKRWVHSTAELPVLQLLAKHGIAVQTEPDTIAVRLGLRVKEGPGVHIQQVMRGGAAELAGFASGDEWIAVEVSTKSVVQTWRLQLLDELPLYAGKAKRVTALVSRDRRILRLLLNLPKPSQATRLSMGDQDIARNWLEGMATHATLSNKTHPKETP